MLITIDMVYCWKIARILNESCCYCPVNRTHHIFPVFCQVNLHVITNALLEGEQLPPLSFYRPISRNMIVWMSRKLRPLLNIRIHVISIALVFDIRSVCLVYDRCVWYTTGVFGIRPVYPRSNKSQQAHLGRRPDVDPARAQAKKRGDADGRPDAVDPFTRDPALLPGCECQQPGPESAYRGRSVLSRRWCSRGPLGPRGCWR